MGRTCAVLAGAAVAIALVALSPSCGPGPVGGADSGVTRDSGLPCSATCQGCCAPNGYCFYPANTVTACGQGGLPCSVCPGANQACAGGRCVDNTCAGCVDNTGTCVAGTSTSACGSQGVSCVACSGGATCANGMCQGGTCSGCTDVVTGLCQPGNAFGACGTGGGACVACAGGQACVNGTCANLPADAGSSSDGGGYAGGPISCSAPGSYNTSNGGSCGSWRWSEKTGDDLPSGCSGTSCCSGGSCINFTPQPTTIAALGQLPVPSGLSSGTPRTGPEWNVYYLKNVTLTGIKLESDSDYHHPLRDPATGATMEVEVPFPGCVNSGSPFYCYITHARGADEAVLLPTGSYTPPPPQDATISVIGVAFFDMLHGSASAAPNGIELHPVLGICFGQDCDPMAYTHQ